MLPQYLYYFLSSSIAEEHVLEQRSTMSYPVFGMKKAREMPVPLPPLAEQQRIVAKLGQLLAHCDALEQRIQASRRLAGQLLQTALREALAGPGGAVVAAAPEARKRPVRAVGMTGDLFAAVG
jgi:type I restriction enzyme S subunit